MIGARRERRMYDGHASVCGGPAHKSGADTARACCQHLIVPPVAAPRAQLGRRARHAPCHVMQFLSPNPPYTCAAQIARGAGVDRDASPAH